MWLVDGSDAMVQVGNINCSGNNIKSNYDDIIINDNIDRIYTSTTSFMKISNIGFGSLKFYKLQLRKSSLQNPQSKGGFVWIWFRAFINMKNHSLYILSVNFLYSYIEYMQNLLIFSWLVAI